MVFGFLVAWVPYASFAGWIFLNKGAPFSALTAAIPAFFAKSSALYNPVIYVLLNKQVGSTYGFVFSIGFLNFSILKQLSCFWRGLVCSYFQFRNCMLTTIGMGGMVEDETSVSASKTEVSSVS